MTDDSEKREREAGGPARKDSRQERLKLALRENLKRRKSQARGRGDIASSNPGADAPHDGSAKQSDE
jgi:hypothetical protein